MAIAKERMDIIDLILQKASNVQIDVLSQTHGTPLHIACRSGNIKIVQKLVMNGANIYHPEPKKNLLPKQVTFNQKIVFLLERYEKIYINKSNQNKEDEQRSVSD